jgi:hypothetical protein
MPVRPTQRDRLLRILRDAGAAGVHTHELRVAGFGNPSQRVTELQAAGHEIVHKRERRGDANGTRYTLKSAGGQSSASHDADDVRDHPHPSGQGSPPSADHDQLVGFDAAIEVGGTTHRKGPYSDVYEDAA